MTKCLQIAYGDGKGTETRPGISSPLIPIFTQTFYNISRTTGMGKDDIPLFSVLLSSLYVRMSANILE